MSPSAFPTPEECLLHQLCTAITPGPSSEPGWALMDCFCPRNAVPYSLAPHTTLSPPTEHLVNWWITRSHHQQGLAASPRHSTAAEGCSGHMVCEREPRNFLSCLWGQVRSLWGQLRPIKNSASEGEAITTAAADTEHPDSTFRNKQSSGLSFLQAST